MNNKIRFLRYQGSKFSLLDDIIDFIDYNYKIFIEPFVGSGAVFLNIKDKFDRYVINDINEYIMVIWKALELYEYDDYINARNKIFNKFGNIKENKQSYYDFREWYNENFHFTNKKEKGLYLFFLANSCINSMLRFGPNGMNQSYGNRLYNIEKDTLIEFNKKLNKLNMFCKDYKEILSDDISDSLIFLDPPYYQRMTSYSSNFNEKDFIELLSKIKKLQDKNKILLTHIFDERINELGLEKEKLRDIRTTSPSKSSKVVAEEYIFYN